MYQVVSGLILGFLAVSSAEAQSATASPCPFTPDYLSAQLGETFEPGVQQQGLIGMGCKYKGKNADLWIDAGQNPAPSAEMWLKMSNPPGTTFTQVDNDPDKALHIYPVAGVSPFPSLFYERKGWLVSISITGVSDKESVELWNEKLVKLKRIP